MSLKDKMYNYLVCKNDCVRYEYERYVNEHLVDHYLHRFKHVRLLLILNIHYRIKKINTPLIYWDKKLKENNIENKVSINEQNHKDAKLENTQISKLVDSTQHNQNKCIEKPNDNQIYVRNPICLQNSGKILFISATGRGDRPILDPSTRYRCFHPAEELLRKGLYTSVISASEFVKQSVPLDYDLYVFHRPTKAEEQHINTLKNNHKTIVADYDDLIFGDEDIAKESSICKNNVASVDECIKIYKNNLEALALFDIFTCSTNTLCQYIRKYKKDAKVFVVHNFLPYSILKKTENYVNIAKNMDRIMYCCGTISHNKDFCEWEEKIIECLEREPNLYFNIVGPLDAPGRINRLPNVTFHKALDYWDLFKYMKESAFTIAPLERTDFNECKSNVKFLEAAVVGANLIATPIEDMCRVKESGIVLCEDSDMLDNIITNRREYINDVISRKNREFILENGSSKTFWMEYKDVFEYLER